MILLALFRIIMIFPFVLYFLLTLYGTNSKSAKLICSFFYMWSLYFIAAYTLTPLVLWLFLSFIFGTVLFLSFQQTKQKYYRLIFNKVLRNFLYKFASIYPFVYMFLMLYGFANEYIKLI